MCGMGTHWRCPRVHIRFRQIDLHRNVASLPGFFSEGISCVVAPFYLPKHRHSVCGAIGDFRLNFWALTRFGRPPRPMPSSTTATLPMSQEWLGHANISTTRLYHRRQKRPEGFADVQSPILRSHQPRSLSDWLFASSARKNARRVCGDCRKTRGPLHRRTNVLSWKPRTGSSTGSFPGVAESAPRRSVRLWPGSTARYILRIFRAAVGVFRVGVNLAKASLPFADRGA